MSARTSESVSVVLFIIKQHRVTNVLDNKILRRAVLHNITVTEVPSEVQGMHMFSVVSDPVEYIRFVSYDSSDSQTAVEFNCRELTDCVLDAYEWAREVMW